LRIYKLFYTIATPLTYYCNPICTTLWQKLFSTQQAFLFAKVFCSRQLVSPYTYHLVFCLYGSSMATVLVLNQINIIWLATSWKNLASQIEIRLWVATFKSSFLQVEFWRGVHKVIPKPLKNLKGKDFKWIFFLRCRKLSILRKNMYKWVLRCSVLFALLYFIHKTHSIANSEIWCSRVQSSFLVCCCS